MPISSTHSLPSASTRVGRFLFLRKFLQHGTQVASVAPSSRFMAQALCQYIDPERRQTILELGAGTGSVTTVAAKRMHPHSTLLAVEMDSDFTQILHRRCPEAYVIEADAAMTCTRLRILGVNQVDLIISGLPIPSLPQKVNQQIFQCIGQIIGEGYFSQLTVMPWVYLGLYRRLFHEVSFKPVWWNIPCGGVYHCRHLRADFLHHLPGKGLPDTELFEGLWGPSGRNSGLTG